MSEWVGFRDRSDAGRQLAEQLAGAGLTDPVIFALPRGGVPVGFEVAERLGAPLEVLVARKVGAPGHEEFGIGAIAEGGVRVADHATLQALGISAMAFARLADAEGSEVDRRVAAYRGDRSLPPMRGRDAVIVDDGLATGVTAEAAVTAARQLDAERVVLAVPVCAADTSRRLATVVDRVVCLSQPVDFVAVGRWYEHFDQTSDDEVVELLARARAAQAP